MIFISIVSLDETIWTLVQRESKAKEVLERLGFSKITNEGMLSTAGKFMTLRKASKLRKINLEQIIDKFKEEGYEVI
ncbi:MAG: DUF1858 domain-containing protein [Clostridium sp.]|nr:DUF1858 domain-containing protein [Clostridium sp.]